MKIYNKQLLKHIKRKHRQLLKDLHPHKLQPNDELHKRYIANFGRTTKEILKRTDT